MPKIDLPVEFADEDDSALDASQIGNLSQSVLYSADWTVETVLAQLERENIELNPRFQRRDAWTIANKSRFIESVVLGLPIPQIVLAEKQHERGQFIILDGKQRLLSLLQFTGNAEGPRNGFRLSNLEVRTDLARKKYQGILKDPGFTQDVNAFLNHTIRTVVIRNWPSLEFLHLVFLRLNTGSVRLSPQELRQALVPGPFVDFADDRAISMDILQTLLSRKSSDPRMRDVELFVRFIAMRQFLNDYNGRMKSFLDFVCMTLNQKWDMVQSSIEDDTNNFVSGLRALLDIFGSDAIARKADSVSFNRAIFDALIFYAADPAIRDSMMKFADEVKSHYQSLVVNREFIDAVESDTAGVPHTHARLALWGSSLREAIQGDFRIPELIIRPQSDGQRIQFHGFR